MRKALRIMAVLAAFGLTAWIGIVALAQSSPTQAPSTTGSSSVSSGDDVKGNCDEAEHANDPGCQGVTVSEDNGANDDNDDQGENEDVNDDHGDDQDEQGEDVNDDNGDDVNDDEQGEDEGNDDQSHDSGSSENSGSGSTNSGPGSDDSGHGGGDGQGGDD